MGAVRHALGRVRATGALLGALFVCLGLLGSFVAGPAAAEDVQLAKKKRAATEFTVASFNILGYSHTRGGARGFLDGVTRMKFVQKILDDNSVDVVGFQELQPEQFAKFKRTNGDDWALYPGKRFERIAMHNSIAWKTGQWKLERARYIKIPYFRGEPVKMPIVRLRNKQTGRVVAFANFHNPADSHGPAQKWRDQARRKQIRLANRKIAQGVPFIITGDMNERDKYFCRMTARTAMHAAAGGSNPADGPCVPPEPTPIDWIFGSPLVDFPVYTRLYDALTHKTTDHPVMVSTVRVS